MTTVIAWVSYDPKFAAAYMASDSRITWDSSSHRRWDAGRKIFPSKLFPDILGYAGDVIFPALALSQIIEAVDPGLMFALTSTPWERHNAIVKCLRASFTHRHQADDKDFSILHLSGFDSPASRTVHAWSIEYCAGSKNWTDRSLAIPPTTGVIERLGTGRGAAKDHLERWNKIAPYSREIFSSFCDAISSGDDGLSGGAPQLAGFYPRVRPGPLVSQWMAKHSSMDCP
ncbi:hypothetical protein [Mesorhizobium sp. M0859]|uniref:hypothetical protein n=1 Tax=Mesorhizobium sp. M0859 TaxID=2957014 RepID=UPI003339CDDB